MRDEGNRWHISDCSTDQSVIRYVVHGCLQHNDVERTLNGRALWAFTRDIMLLSSDVYLPRVFDNDIRSVDVPILKCVSHD